MTDDTDMKEVNKQVAAAAAAPDDDEEDEEEEEDLEQLQAEIARMEAEAARISKETEELENGGDAADSKEKTADSSTKEAAAAKDQCSIYVGQVDYAATPEELLGHFEACGTVERVTIVCDKFTGKPKGFAYLEFENEAAVENAVKLDGSEFKGRTLKVTHKRVNQPGFHFQQQQQEGGYRGGRGRGRGGFRGRGRGFRGRGGGFRGRGGGGFRGGGRGGGGYHPYY